MVNNIVQNITEYNNTKYFQEDPIAFPRRFFESYKRGESQLQDVEISGLLSAHLAWGRRSMIVRDCNRMFDEMSWQPLEYVLNGNYRHDDVSMHRTIKWSEFALICANLRAFYAPEGRFDSARSVEQLSPDEIRTEIFGQKSDKNAANKKIHMFRRWMVRRDGIVDFGLWRNTDPSELIIPLDVHVHQMALELGITQRKSADYKTAKEITDFFKNLYPNDPCIGDFALFGYGVMRVKSPESRVQRKTLDSRLSTLDLKNN